MMREIPSRLRALSPGWWGAVAGAAAAGATIYPGRRLIAAAVGAVGVLAIAIWRDPGACATCADSPGPTAADPVTDPAPVRPLTWNEGFGLMSTAAGHKEESCR
jgi:hypothetical protein